MLAASYNSHAGPNLGKMLADPASLPKTRMQTFKEKVARTHKKLDGVLAWLE